MYLSKLELLGFKSFPNKTELVFDNGLTAIVGPNGCGKTNLLDAVRWVLGEQRVTLLRGSKMEEVIFNGTRELKPLGMAEVHLMIKNDKGILPIDYSDVRVSRRLYRSGESEYLLNGAPCRLKDITDLFLDTGMGTHAYSVIQPNMIEAVLSDKAEDRRLLFEEASGITKYKLRKRAALRKLEFTESDILRINDIITEVERQVNSLRRQVRRAERFKKFTQEAKELEIKLAQADFEELKERNNELEQSIGQLKKQMTEHTTDLSKQEAESENLRLKLLEAEKELVAHQKKLVEDTEGIHQVERDTLVRRERKTGLEKSIARLRQELSDLKNRVELFENEKTEKQKELEETTQKLEQKEKELSQKEEELTAVDEEREKVKKAFEDLGKQQTNYEEELNQKKSKVANLEGSFKQLEQRKKSLMEEGDVLSTRLSELKSAIGELSSTCAQKNEVIEKEDAEKGGLEKKREAKADELKGLSEEIVKLGNKLSSEKAKSTLLTEMVREYQGFGGGVKYILDRRASLPGIIDSVANLISTDEEYLLAIESALGETAQFLVCEDDASAFGAISSLKENKQGRATFLISEKIKRFTQPMQAADYKKEDGIVGWAPDLVRCEEKHKLIVKLLLGDVLLINSFERAKKLASTLGDRFCLVSLDGQVLKPEGLMEGGSEKEISLLGREVQIQKVKENISVLEGKFKEIEEKKRKKEDENLKLNQLLNEKINHIRELSQELGEKRMELGQAKFEKKRLMERSETVSGELVGIEKQTNDLENLLHQIKSETRLLESKRDELSEKVLETKEELERIDEEKNNQFEKTSSYRIDLVSLSGKKEQLENDIVRLTEMIEDVRKTMDAREKEIESSQHSIEEIVLNSSDVDVKLKELFEQKERDEKIYNSWQGKYSQLQEEVTSRENQLKSVRQTKDEFQEKVHNLELEKLEKATRMRSIRDKVWEEHQVNLEDFKPLYPEEKDSLEDYRQRIRDLKEVISTLGPVNLVALEEYQVSKERLDFLKGQMKDLVEAKGSLNSTISKIDETAREMFMQTFQQIKTNFQTVFAQLFEGGEADLALQSEMDILESPIEISARPRGKKLININQLSGGEKALTAISLIFAIYLVKPSPFCILDEIDAPLDDANVKRFLKIVKHFSQNTQFLIITHNKLSMEAADTLYGITMEQAGVSKIVSVKLGHQEVLAGEQN